MGQAWPPVARPFSYLPRIFDLTPGTGDNSSRSRRDAPGPGPAGWLCQQGQAVSTALRVSLRARDSGGRAREASSAGEDAVSREWPGGPQVETLSTILRTSGGQEKRTSGFTQVKLDTLRGLSREV